MQRPGETSSRGLKVKTVVCRGASRKIWKQHGGVVHETKDIRVIRLHFKEQGDFVRSGVFGEVPHLRVWSHAMLTKKQKNYTYVLNWYTSSCSCLSATFPLFLLFSSLTKFQKGICSLVDAHVQSCKLKKSSLGSRFVRS